ncbi:hypothetical protein MHI01_29395 [Paenibacillus sp. FSL M7-0656]|uniref:hypothetical protein n=1 Tax=Paenibacillus sp. FSL M7-0656 TaxID=2921534 RepID=UPI0030FB3FB3
MDNTIKYALALNVLGDKINAVSTELKEAEKLASELKYDELLKRKSVLESAISRYASIRNELAVLDRPAVIEREHHQLVDAFDELIHGTKLMDQGLNLKDMKVTPEKILNGFQLQLKSQKDTMDVTNRIVEKLSK